MSPDSLLSGGGWVQDYLNMASNYYQGLIDPLKVAKGHIASNVKYNAIAR